MTTISTYLEQQRDTFEHDLCELLRIPSVSTDSKYKSDVKRAAEWVANQFRGMDMKTELVDRGGHPIVYAESPPVENAPVVLVYGHYDVQPPDPLDEWVTSPFEPTVRDGNVYARGATDDKGQMLTHVKSAQAWMATQGSLPLQLKYVIEGEEEVGSEGLTAWLPEARDRLACDVVVISDTSQFAKGQPAITYGLRGIAYFELRVRGPRQDLHSGTFGGAVINPLNALTRMLAGLQDGEGKVQIPGFYDSVEPLTADERQAFADLDFDEDGFRRQVGVKELGGETGYSTLERRWARPTFDINGIWGGYQGEGGKTVLPASAGAKFSFRLVPNQDPHQVAEQLRTRLAELCPAGVEMELIDMHGGSGFVADRESPYMSAAAEAIEKSFGKPPVLIREGGSIPIVTAFFENLDSDVLLLGWGLDDDNTHSPNEKFSLGDYHRGIAASAYLWEALGKIQK